VRKKKKSYFSTSLVREKEMGGLSITIKKGGTAASGRASVRNRNPHGGSGKNLWNGIRP